MTDRDTLGSRVETLETRVAHQDRVIEDLNTTITAQWRMIDGLVREIAALKDGFEGLATASAPVERPPPHY
jgi:SlyX protein